MRIIFTTENKRKILLILLGLLIIVMLALGILFLYKDAIFRVTTNSAQNEDQNSAQSDLNGFYIGSSIDLGKKKTLTRLFFSDVKITNITKEQQKMSLQVSIRLNGEYITTTIKTSNFVILKNIGIEELAYDEYFDQIDISNTNLLDLNETYQALFFYIPQGYNVTSEDINNYCKSTNPELDTKSICDSVPNAVFPLDTDINSYILNKLNNLIDGVNFEDLIFSALYLDK